MDLVEPTSPDFLRRAHVLVGVTIGKPLFVPSFAVYRGDRRRIRMGSPVFAHGNLDKIRRTLATMIESMVSIGDAFRCKNTDFGLPPLAERVYTVEVLDLGGNMVILRSGDIYDPTKIVVYKVESGSLVPDQAAAESLTAFVAAETDDDFKRELTDRIMDLVQTLSHVEL